MEHGESRYFDFSEDEQILGDFDPVSSDDRDIAFQAAILRKHLMWKNPSSRIAVLLAHESLLQTGRQLMLARFLSQIRWGIFAIVVLLGYLAYKVT